MEGQLAFASLLRRLPRLKLAVPYNELHWNHGDGLVLRLSAWVKAEDAQGGRSALVLLARDVLKKAKVELAPTPR